MLLPSDCWRVEDHSQPLVVHKTGTETIGFLGRRRTFSSFITRASETSQHDGRTRDGGGSEPRTMADMARKASYVESGNLARVLQGPHGGEIDPLRRHGSRSTMLRMDR